MFVKFWDLDTQHCFLTLVGHKNEVSNYIWLEVWNNVDWNIKQSSLTEMSTILGENKCADIYYMSF